MAFGLLDGTDAALDATVNLGSGTVSVKCIFNYMSIDFSKAMIPRITFCSSGWSSKFVSMKSCDGRFEGYQSKGNALSDPLAWFTQTVSAAVVVTLSSGCSISGNFFCVGDHEGVRAFADTERGINFTNDGAISTAWVIV